MIERKHENNFLQVKIENFEKKIVCVFSYFLKSKNLKTPKTPKTPKFRRRCF